MNQKTLTENNGLEEAKGRRVSGPRNHTPLTLGHKRCPQRGQPFPVKEQMGPVIHVYGTFWGSFLDDHVTQENGRTRAESTFIGPYTEI